MKSRIDESNSARGKTADELEKEKQARAAESGELRRRLNDVTESSVQETRSKNDQIKRL